MFFKLFRSFLLVFVILQFSYTVGPSMYKEMRRESYLGYLATVNYIQKIKLPKKYRKWATKDIARFNKLIPSIKPAIRYGKKGHRPITISMKKLKGARLGVAYQMGHACNIYITTKLNKEVFRSVLIHEILHCYGYDHSPNYRDVMYRSNLYWLVSPMSDTYYADDIIHNREGWLNE